MIDWNGNHRLDCVDIGIDIAAQPAETETGIELGGYWFRFIQELEPKRTLGGKSRYLTRRPIICGKPERN